LFHDNPSFAFLLGFGSAISLVIGSAIGLIAKPSAVVTSVCMAFGAGALLFALSIEIVAHSYHMAGFGPLAIGCIAVGCCSSCSTRSSTVAVASCARPRR
jgi:zinc transporter ZupT